MKKGISLIVLVITIIIIIILAGAVILNLADNNPIDNANAAAVLSEQSDLNSAITIYIGSVAADEASAYKFSLVDPTAKGVSADCLDANGNKIGEGYYKLEQIKVTCSEAFTAKKFPDDKASDFVTRLGMNNAKYAGKGYTIVMNLSGNVKLVQEVIDAK